MEIVKLLQNHYIQWCKLLWRFSTD